MKKFACILALTLLAACGGKPPQPPIVLQHGIFTYTTLAAQAKVVGVEPLTTSSVTHMVTPRGGHEAILLNDGTVLIAGGSPDSNNPLNSAEIYDPSTGSFTQIAAQMVSTRTNFCSTKLDDGSVLLIGGNNGSVSTTEIYHPGVHGTFTFGGTLPFQVNTRSESAYNLGGTRVLLINWWSGATGDPTITQPPYVINMSTWEMTPVQNAPALQNGATAQLDNGDVIICGGEDTSGKLTDGIYVISADTSTCTRIGTLTQAKSFMVALTKHDPSGSTNVWIYGGKTATSHDGCKEVEHFSYSGSVSPTVVGVFQDTYANAKLNSVFLQNGFSLHVNGSGIISGVQMIYEETTNLSGFTASLNTPRSQFRLTPLPNSNQCLVTGGKTDAASNAMTDSTELFDSQDNLFVTLPCADLPLGGQVELTIHDELASNVTVSPASPVTQDGAHCKFTFTAPSIMPLGTHCAYVTISAVGKISVTVKIRLH